MAKTKPMAAVYCEIQLRGKLKCKTSRFEDPSRPVSDFPIEITSIYKPKLSKKSSKMFENVQKCWKMFENVLKNVQKCLKKFKNVQKCSKMFKKVQKCSKMFKNVQKCLNFLKHF